MTSVTVEVLGAGGAFPTPRPLCRCRVCLEAIERGVPYSRSGPGYFIHGPDILIDTSEDIRMQLTRSGIERVEACFYSHWHPDHVLGRRVWECNFDPLNGSYASRSTTVYVPDRVCEDMKQYHGTWGNLEYLQSRGAIRLVVVKDGERIKVGNCYVTPFSLPEQYVFAFLVETPLKKALIAPDELFGWDGCSSLLDNLDLAILPMGILETNPLTGARRLAEGYPKRIREATFEETLEIAERIKARRTVLSHIEEPDEVSFDDLRKIAAHVSTTHSRVEFAYDTQRLEL